MNEAGVVQRMNEAVSLWSFGLIGTVAGMAGWVFFFGLLYLYHRLWRSAGNVERLKLREAVTEAREMLEELRRSNDELTERNKVLHEQHQDMRSKYRDLMASYDSLAAKVAKLNGDLRYVSEKQAEQYGELLQLKAKHGEL